MSKILVVTHGSLGDLYPYVALALGLKRRGHDVMVGTCSCYRERIEAWGLRFRPIRPDVAWLDDAERMQFYSHPRLGLMRVGRDVFMAELKESYEDTLAAAEGMDLLVTMMASYATRLVAEKTGIPWASAVHVPMGFFSTKDVPVLEISPTFTKMFRGLGPAFWRPMFWLGKRASRPLAKPWYRLRSELGLPRTKEGNPLADSHSPFLVLGLFSKWFADKQSDWPAQTVVTGFPFFESDDERELPEALSEFLDNGPPPIVFTLGSAVSRNPGSFYEVGIEAAMKLGQRAVVVTGKDPAGEIAPASKDWIAVEYAPFGKLFPKAALVVHHGGAGTTALAMRAGRPMLIVPFAWDQPDHAARVTRLGIGRSISKNRYKVDRVAKELKRLIETPSYAERAKEVGERIRKEDGVGAACDTLENRFGLCRTQKESNERDILKLENSRI